MPVEYNAHKGIVTDDLDWQGCRNGPRDDLRDPGN
jgi:hypothetical protein